MSTTNPISQSQFTKYPDSSSQNDSSRKPVSHHDLKNFGQDMTPKATGIPHKSSGPEEVPPIFFLGDRPEITFVKNSPDEIKIIYKDAAIQVDRNTGYMLGDHEKFNHIYRFDPNSFPQYQEVRLEKVGYWKLSGKYKPANSDSY